MQDHFFKAIRFAGSALLISILPAAAAGQARPLVSNQMAISQTEGALHLEVADDELGAHAGIVVEYVRENWTDVVRFVASGFVISLLLTTVPLLISSFSTRRVIAALMIVGVFFLTSAFAAALSECENTREGRCEPVTREYAKWFALTGLRWLLRR